MTRPPAIRLLQDFDLCIRGGHLIDGTMDEPRRTDLGVVGDTIVAIGDLAGAVAVHDLDATGLIVAPGFIDVHSHSDPVLLIDPAASTKVLQGVTTEVIGNCGMGVFPPAPGRVFLGLDLDRVLPNAPADMDEYARLLESSPPALNVAVLLGLGSLLDSAQSQGLQFAGVLALAERGLAQGALGVSVGLTYDPDRILAADQLLELATLVHASSGRLAAHVRDEGSGTFGLLPAIREVLDLTRNTECGLQISHLKAIGPAGWDQLSAAINEIDSVARRAGPVTADVYPYTATETLLSAALRSPPGDRGQLRAAIDRRGGPERLVISHSTSSPHLEGLSLADASRAEETDLVVLLGELMADPTTTVISHSLRSQDVDAVLGQAWCGVASDGMALGAGSAHLFSRPHPRSAGTFPRLLGEYVRKRKRLGLGEAIRKCTSQAADAFGLRDRGRLVSGLKADITVFDALTVESRADYLQPLTPPIGISYVIVNGVVAVDAGAQTDARAGQVLRRASKR